MNSEKWIFKKRYVNSECLRYANGDILVSNFYYKIFKYRDRK